MKKGRVDITLAISVTTLLICGMLMVFSASSVMANANYGSLFFFFRKQILFGIVALFLMIGFSHFKYQHFKYGKVPLVLVSISIVLLVGLFIAGTRINGAFRWYNLGFYNFQPSEFAKMSLIIYFAYFLSSRGQRIRDIKTGLMPLIIVLISVVVLIMFQPDLSTSLMIVLITGTMLFVSRVKLVHIAGIITMIVPFAVYMLSTRKYQAGRIRDWIAAWEDPLLAGYQVKQSLIGIGRGGITGQGIGQSKQKFFFLPDSHTDFIFSIIGEEFGFIGTTIILFLFLVILYKGLQIASRVNDPFAKFLALGITFNIVYYAFTNAAVVTMLLPATGLPMPFISYGGTHLVFLGMMVGILLNISRYTQHKPVPDHYVTGTRTQMRKHKTVLMVD